MILLFLFFNSILSTPSFAEPPVLRISMDREPARLKWNDPLPDAEVWITSFLMRGMVKVDEGGKVVCDLCQNFQISDDAKSIRFLITPNQLWSDDVPLEAAQFVEAYKSVSRHSALARVESIKAESPLSLIVTLKEPDPNFVHRFAHPVLFPSRAQTGPTLGPYVLAAWEKGKRIVLEGNPQYRGQRPVYRVEFIFGSRKDQLERFRRGKIDILSHPTTAEALGASGAALQTSSLLATRALFLRLDRKPTSQIALRRAIVYGIKRSSISSLLGNGERNPTGLFPPGIPGFRELPLITEDPVRSKNERASLGPDPIELEVMITDDPTDLKLVQWLSEQLATQKIKVNWRKLDHSRFKKKIDQGDFSAAIMNLKLESLDPLEFLKRFGSDHPNNASGIKSVALDSLLSSIQRLKQGSDAQKLLDQATELIERELVAVIPLGYPSRPFLLGSRVQSFAVTPFGDPDLVKIKLRE